MRVKTKTIEGKNLLGFLQAFYNHYVCLNLTQHPRTFFLANFAVSRGPVATGWASKQEKKIDYSVLFFTAQALQGIWEVS